MRMQILIMVGILMLGVVVCSTARAAAFKEGEWSLAMTMKLDENSAEAKQMKQAMKEMESMPPEARAMMQGMGMQMGAGPQGGMTTTITHCLTGEDVVPDSKAANKNCQESHEIKGSTVTFQSVCKDKKGEITTNGVMTYKGDSMKGEIKSRTVSRGKMTDTTMEIAGKYLGPCKKK
jgi:hypothetical protein